MVNIIDKYFPTINVTINKFKENEYIKLVNEIDKLKLKSKKSDKLTINVDIYYLKDYSIGCINKLRNYLDNLDFQSIITVNIYLDKNMNNFFLKSYIYVNNKMNSKLKFNVIELDKPKKWTN